MEVQGILEWRKWISEEDWAGTTYFGVCDWGTLANNINAGLTPEDEPIWSIYKLVETAVWVAITTERFSPVDSNWVKIDTSSLVRNAKTTLTYI